MFVRNFNVPPPPLGHVKVDGVDALRSFLNAAGVLGPQQDKAIADVEKDGVALVRDVLLDEACITRHGL